MSKHVRTDDNTSCEVRIEDYRRIKRLIDEFGDAAYPAIHRYHTACGYEAGVDLLLDLLDQEHLSRAAIRNDPVGCLLLLFKAFFHRRRGNQPDLGFEGHVVTLKTANSVFCPSPTAQKQSGVPHHDVCAIHKRAFVEGMAQSLVAFVPGVEIHYANRSSRTLDPAADCVETFSVVTPW